MGTDLMEWLVIWGVANAFGFAFKEVLVRLATGALEDYVKDFFKGCIKDLVDLAKEKPLKVAFGQALKEFLGLVQQELEDADVDEAKLEQYTDALDEFIRNQAVIQNLGKPFQKALGKISQGDNQYLDTGIFTRTWNHLNLKPLPDDFDWEMVARRYVKKVDFILRGSDELQKLLDSENLARIRENVEKLAPISPDFDLSRYQEGLITAYGKLRLDSLDTSGWEYPLQLWNIFVPPKVREESNPQQPPSSVLNLLNDEQAYKYIVILGNPGSGKSTLAQYRTLMWARTKPSALQLLELPLLIELRNYIENREKSLCKNFLEYFNQGTGILGGTLNHHKLDEWLRNRKSLVIFDGLDEVLEPRERENVVIDIVNFTKIYPKARVLVTSRVIGYEQQRQRLRNANFRDFMLQDLDTQQIQGFVTQWHKLAFDGDEYEGEKRRDRLQRAIDNSPTFRELAGNPLLLTMMAILNRHEELPRDRETLYKQASCVLLQRWDAAKNLPDDKKLDPKLADYLDYKAKQGMLRAVAHKMHMNGNGLANNLTISAEELEDTLASYLEKIVPHESRVVARVMMYQLTTRSFILCFMGGDAYGFVHRTFLEYFCAWHFVWEYERAKTITLDYLKKEVFAKRLREEYWRKILILINAMILEKFAAKIIDFLGEQNGHDNGFKNLFLAAYCLSSVRSRSLIKETDDKLLSKFKRLFEGQNEVTDEVRSRAVEAIKATWKDDPETLSWVETLVR
jgi:predicted NACHT family NTPase